MKAIIVARVSTEDQREAGNSLPAQVSRMQNYCERKDFIIVETFSFDESAYKSKRDEFDKIINCINSLKEKVIVCFDKVDRLSRNVFDKRVAELYGKALEGFIELHFVSDNQILNEKLSATEKSGFSMNLVMASYYSNAISDNVKRANEQMRKRGEWTSKPRIGYLNRRDLKDKGLIIVDSERSHLIIKMFEMYSTGNYSLESIRQEVTKLGLRSKDGNILSRSCIENILKDTFYCGTAMSKKYGSYTHKYDRLISKELFEQCNAVRYGKRTRPSKMMSKDYIFKGLLICSTCGCRITPEIKKGKFIYYSCTNAKGICKRQYIPEKKLLEPIYGLLDRFGSITEQTQNTLVEELRKTTEEEVVFHQNQVNRIFNEKAKIDERTQRLLDAYLDQCITKDEYDKKRQEYADKEQLLNIEMEEHTKANYDYQTTVATVLNIARRAKEIFESSETFEKRQFINYLIQNPTVNEKTLSFTLRSPFNLVLELSQSPSVQAIVDEFRTMNWVEIDKWIKYSGILNIGNSSYLAK